MSSRPICVNCNRQYGKRYILHEIVYWDTPTAEVPAIHAPDKKPYKVPFGPIAQAPPHRGIGIVTQETTPYLSADGRMVMYRYVWDGLTWCANYHPFCTLRCALDYARKAHASKQFPQSKLKAVK